MSQQQQEEVTEFYDKFVDKQAKVGITPRHRIIIKNLKKIGLSPSSNVLEIGCGIGTVSTLIINAIPSGKFVGVDILCDLRRKMKSEL